MRSIRFVLRQYLDFLSVMEYLPLLRKLFLVETRRWLLMVGLIGAIYLAFQSFLLPHGESQIHNQLNHETMDSNSNSGMIRNSLTVHGFDVSKPENGEGDEDLEVSSNEHVFKASAPEKMVAINDSFESSSLKIQKNITEAGNSLYLEQIVGSNRTMIGNVDGNFIISEEVHRISDRKMSDEDLQLSADDSFSLEKIAAMDDASGLVELENLSSKGSEVEEDEPRPTLSSMVRTRASAAMDDDLTNTTHEIKRMKYDQPPMKVTSIHEMINTLARRSSSRATRPKWSSARDREILAAKSKIKNTPVLRNDPELDVSLFRNLSTFKRSYELMERTLKVYVYKEGNKPIFHRPILKGLYSSEGWFMKLMEGNKNYNVKDPRRAHLFYIPFSSRELQLVLYVPNSHNRTNLRNYLKDYTESIAAKYPYFNRTGGADHFLVACHDWAPYVTRPHMDRCMKAFCNADLNIGFKLGKDVSLPETYVRSGKNPLRDLGGKPPSQREILAFYAGKMHGYLRTILLAYWKDKDSDMKILGPMPPGVKSKMRYIEYMKSSKYCICPKGYEVNSPRLVEALFYECVPVIVSDNFVLPFLDVFDWSAFSVVVAEKDIPRLKEILVSIPEEKYLEMQSRVRKVQRHFLWHATPLKYDLFHMILQSIWYNRVFQI